MKGVRPPDPKVHPGEIVGRRAFGDDKSIFFTTDGSREYKLNVFMDTRAGGVSVDRLGTGSVDRKRVRYLDPLGVEMGRRNGKKFRGWAQFPIREFVKYTQSTVPKGEDNPFHAEVMRDDFSTNAAKRTLAYAMRYMANQQEFVRSPSEERKTEDGRSMVWKRLLGQAWSTIRRIFGWGQSSETSGGGGAGSR